MKSYAYAYLDASIISEFNAPNILYLILSEIVPKNKAGSYETTANYLLKNRIS